MLCVRLVTMLLNRFLSPFRWVAAFFCKLKISRDMFVVGTLGLASSLAYPLTGGNFLALWLKYQSVDVAVIGLFSLLQLPYALKVFWAPFLDTIHIPYLTRRLGFRRSWLLAFQIAIMISVIVVGQVDPLKHMWLFVALTLFLGFCAASHGVLYLAYQMQVISPEQWGFGEACGVFGFRSGLVFTGTLGIALSEFVSWNVIFMIVGFLMLFPILVLLFFGTADRLVGRVIKAENGKRGFLSYIRAAVVSPVKDFASRRRWAVILMFMVLYLAQDSLLGNMVAIFYNDIGFTRLQFALVYKFFGLWSSILGGLIAAYYIKKHGYFYVLLWGLILYAVSGLGFLIQLAAGANIYILMVTSFCEEVLRGFTMTSMFSYQLTCCMPQFASAQLALLTGLHYFSKCLLGSVAGYMVSFMGWGGFFVAVILSNIPALFCLMFLPFFVRASLRK